MCTGYRCIALATHTNGLACQDVLSLPGIEVLLHIFLSAVYAIKNVVVDGLLQNVDCAYSFASVVCSLIWLESSVTCIVIKKVPFGFFPVSKGEHTYSYCTRLRLK